MNWGAEQLRKYYKREWIIWYKATAGEWAILE
jgi:hypothetical protein